MKNKSLFCFFTAAIVTLLGCSTTAPTTSPPSVRVSPVTQRPQPVTATSSKAPLVTPLPTSSDFAQSILFFGYGGGGGGCEHPPAPSVVGGTTYPTEHSDFAPGLLSDYPRSAYLCLAGAPKNVQIDIELISPDKKVTLSAAVQIVDSTRYKNTFLVRWKGYPDAWAEDVGGDQDWLGAGAYKEGGINVASLRIWWAGMLQSGVWKIKVSWPGQSIYGDFHANTHILPEISLGDPDSQTKLFPIIDSFEPYACRPVGYDQPYSAVIEGFPPNTLVHGLVYRIESHGFNQIAHLDYQTTTNSNAQGIGRMGLPPTLSQASMYYLIGVLDPSAKIAEDTGVTKDAFNFPSIANAMDCFVVTKNSNSQIPASCPGAPLQQMRVNERGYVCTKSDRVRLRTSPSQSSNIIAELAPGARFTVIGGPSCSGSSSWWQIRTDAGDVGWVSEGGDEVDPYFICPLP